MTTMFNHNGRNYAQNEKGNRFYRQGDDGRYVRISQHAYEEAFAEFLEKTTEKAELEDDTNAIAEHTAEMTQEETKEDAEHTRNIEALTPASDAKKTPKKAKKNTRKKKVLVGGLEIEDDGIHLMLTPKQVDFIKHLPDTCFWQDGLNSAPWVDCLCDDIGGQFEGKPMTVGAMISTLREKKVLVVSIGKYDNKKAKCIKLTDLGQRVAVLIGIA